MTTARIATVLLAVAAMTSAAAQSHLALPDTKAGHLLAEWTQLCDSPNVAKFRAWAQANLNERALTRIGADAFATEMTADCAANGGYELLQIQQSKPDEVSALGLARKTNVYVSVHMGVSPEGKARAIGSSPTTPPESALPKDLSDKAVAKYLDSSLEKLADTDQFSGIAVLARGTTPIANKSAGYANRAKHTPITMQTQFTLGSMGKMFTAAAIGQLVDQKKMSFSDVVGKFFPDYPNKTVREKVTVGMLLSHTSGMGDFLRKRTPAMMKNGVKRAAEFMPLYDQDEPQFEPGKGWSYSNAGLALAGAIVEKVSGEDYPSYIRKHIFDVAGMRNSDPNNIPHVTAEMVTPYTEAGSAEAKHHWQEAEHDIGSPAGGAISTAEDLLKFADALRSGKLVSKATFATMAESHAETPFGGHYGYAMEIADVYGQKVVGHNGGFPGVSTELYIVVDSPYTAVVLANQDPPAAEVAGETIRAIAVEKAKQNK